MVYGSFTLEASVTTTELQVPSSRAQTCQAPIAGDDTALHATSSQRVAAYFWDFEQTVGIKNLDINNSPFTIHPAPCVLSDMSEKAPSLTAAAVSSLILGLLAGYFIGQGSSIGVFGGANSAKKSWPNSYDVKVHADSSDDQADDEDDADEDDEDQDEGDGKELRDFSTSSEEVKLVLAVRTDLGMGKGTYTHHLH